MTLSAESLLVAVVRAELPSPASTLTPRPAPPSDRPRCCEGLLRLGLKQDSDAE